MERESRLKIESEFNSKNSGNAFRSVKHLKKYNNLKDTKGICLQKINTKTDGGPFTPVNVIDVNLVI